MPTGLWSIKTGNEGSKKISTDALQKNRYQGYKLPGTKTALSQESNPGNRIDSWACNGAT